MGENVAALGNGSSPSGRWSPFGRRPGTDRDGIEASIASAGRLLCEANRKGIRVPKDVVSVYFMAKEAQDNGRLDAALKTKLWNAYSVLQNITEPTARARRLYRVVFYVTLVLLLATQCYFMIGVGTRDQIQRLRDEAFTLTGQLAAARGQAPISAELQGVAAQRNQEEVVRERIKQVGQDIVAYHQLAEGLMPYVGGTADPFVDQSLRLATLDLLLNFLGKYVLPALYGLLGACAFVLRQLSDEIGKLRFVHDRQVQYTLRLNIGLLGGLAVGWFINPGEGGSVIANLSPLALAFVAGYGSDLLFALFDRIVAAFAPQRGDDARETTVEERVGGLERVTETRTATRVAGERPGEEERPGARPSAGTPEAEDAASGGRMTERPAEPPRPPAPKDQAA